METPADRRNKHYFEKQTMDQNFFAEYLPYISLAAGLIALAVAGFWVSSKARLKQTGIPADGIIFEQVFDNSFDRSAKRNKITIRFVTRTGDWITEIMEQDFSISFIGQYKDGETIKVYYNQENPTEFYVDTKQSEFLGRLILGLVGVVFLPVGLYKIF